MLETTLCYIEQNEKYLMLHRIKKKNDLNKDKWIGIGGKFLPNETPDACLLREVKEETGLSLTEYRYRGIVHFCPDTPLYEVMHLYTATAFTGTLLTQCNEGHLEWVDKTKIESLPLWAGDKIFLNLIADASTPFFTLSLSYDGDCLTRAILNGKELLL